MAGRLLDSSGFDIDRVRKGLILMALGAESNRRHQHTERLAPKPTAW
jgi:hypothetical protein